MWRDIEAALSPVIGPRGIAALYQRSLHLAGADHPWLSAAYEGALQPGDFSALRATLSRQSVADAAAAHAAMLQIFRDLLDNLIGRSLTQRLLQAVWDQPSSGHAVQDISP
jgi:type II secretory pathway component PulK